MIDYIGMLHEFHTKYGHHISRLPERHDTIPDEVMWLRFNLIDEEFQEFRKATNRNDIAKELADLLYVVFGTCVSYGIPIDEVFEEVHRANMTKSATKDVNGKTEKGPGYQPPDIGRILRKYIV